MNLEDEHYFILHKAISEPIVSDRKYFLDNVSLKVFSSHYDGHNWRPHYRNIHVEPNIQTVEFFSQAIHLLNTGKANFIELKPVSTLVKLNFLIDFVSNHVQNQELKDLLQKELEKFDDTSELDFHTELKQMDMEAHIAFDREKALFRLEKIKECYIFLDIHTILEVVW